MELNKLVTGSHESLYYCKSGKIIDQKMCELLGFKGTIPVLDNKVEAKPSTTLKTKQTIKVEVNEKTGEKYLNFNGRKLRMVSGAELPLHLKQSAQMIKAMPKGTSVDNKLVKIKIIGAMLQQPANPAKNPVQTTTSVKTNVNKTDKDGAASLSHKTTLIKESNRTPVKIPSSSKATTESSTVDDVKKHTVTVPLSKENRKDLKVKHGSGVRKMNPLDLSKEKLNSGGSQPQKSNMCIQAKPETKDQSLTAVPETVDQYVQTDPAITKEEEALLEKFLNTDFLDFISSDAPIPVPGKSMTPKYVAMTEQKPTTAHNEKLTMFFKDLNTALIPDVNGNMPIHVGVLSNNVNVVRRCCSVLKAIQKPVDIVNLGDLTPLQLAVLNDANAQIVKILLAYGANLDVVDAEGNNILHLAIECKRVDMFDTLLRFADERGFNLNDFNADGLTPLMMCCCNGLIQCADLLVKYDADVNARDRKSGRTALFHAAENHNYEMVQLLLYYNADTKIKNFFGTSPHDAMYEVEEMPENIKNAILGKNSKRKHTEEPKILKVRRIDEASKLKTYARYKKIDHFEFKALSAKAK